MRFDTWFEGREGLLCVFQAGAVNGVGSIEVHSRRRQLAPSRSCLASLGANAVETFLWVERRTLQYGLSLMVMMRARSVLSSCLTVMHEYIYIYTWRVRHTRGSAFNGGSSELGSYDGLINPKHLSYLCRCGAPNALNEQQVGVRNEVQSDGIFEDPANRADHPLF